MTQRRAKYNAQKTVIDGIAFDSKREAGRYNVLRLLQLAGEISNLEIQPEFVLQAAFIDAQGKKHRAIKYRADFRYFDHASGKQIVEDVKGMKTQVYRIKKKLLLAKYRDFEFREVE